VNRVLVQYDYVINRVAKLYNHSGIPKDVSLIPTNQANHFYEQIRECVHWNPAFNFGM